MPLLEFSCSRCRKNHELFLSFDDRETICCPGCGGDLEVAPFIRVPLLPLMSLPFPRSPGELEEHHDTAAGAGKSSSSG